MSTPLERLQETSEALRAAVASADALLAARQHADDATLRSMRNQLEDWRLAAASGYADEEQFLAELSRAGNEWLTLVGSSKRHGFEEWKMRNAVFTHILEARDPLKF